MSEQITYDDKVDLVVATNTANINKVTANDMNEIKSVVNANADTLVTTNSNIGTLSNLTTTDKTSVVNAINELNAPEKWVNVGATNSNDGRRVWFSKSRNVFDKSITKTSQASALLITETSLDTGKRLTLTGNATSGNVFVVYTIMDLTNYVGKTIRFKADFTPSGTNNGNYYIGICNKDGSNRNALGGTPNTSGTTTSFVVPTLTSPQTWLCLALYINTSGAISTNTYVDFTNMIITINDTNMTYEPYIQQGIYVDNELLYQVPKLLWQNTDTSSVFANQEISLNDNINNYQYYEILSYWAMVDKQSAFLVENYLQLKSTRE